MIFSNLPKATAVLTIFFIILSSPKTHAHCDTLDGPVVSAARKALESGDINFVLVWIQDKDEKEIKDAFRKTLAVRKIGGEAKDLADKYFFETIVRVHRAGEGAPYTGLKESEKNFGPAIPAADKALETGNLEPVIKMLNSLMIDGLKKSFQKTFAAKKFEVSDVRRGREYVDNYVTFIHYVERLYESANSPAHGHFPESRTENHRD